MMNKDENIRYILDRGLIRPKTPRERVADILRALGLKYIFWNTAYSLIFAALTVMVVLAVFVAVPDSYRFSVTVAAAPLLYLLIAVFTETTERANGIYELKQTCHYTIQQITALRTAFYSLAGAVYTAALAVSAMRSSDEFLPMLALGLLALSVCAVPQLLITRLSRSKWTNAMYAAIWVFVNLALPVKFGASWENNLANVPVVFSFGVAAVATITLAYLIRKMLMEVKPYARA
jgi:uncharacterized membrane protein YqjE